MVPLGARVAVLDSVSECMSRPPPKKLPCLSMRSGGTVDAASRCARTGAVTRTQPRISATRYEDFVTSPPGNLDCRELYADRSWHVHLRAGRRQLSAVTIDGKRHDVDGALIRREKEPSRRVEVEPARRGPLRRNDDHERHPAARLVDA